jgi:leader peptidase (prepilin peptidase) / N-methyltransferase
MDGAHIILLCFLFVLGTIVGSFLNVVVYRLPRGGSLIYPGSRCPACGHDIRWHDNVPIVGWLWLGGRCRDCKSPISGRYPLVEIAVGILFLAVGWVDWIRPQGLAINAQTAAVGANPTQDLPPLDLLICQLRFVFQLILLSTLLAAALIDFDRARMVRQLITWPSAVGMLLAIGWPAVQALPLVRTADPSALGARFLAFGTSFVGLLTAMGIRLVVFRYLGLNRARETGLWNATLAIYAVGAFLGWQATLLIGLSAVAWPFVSRLPRLKGSLGRISATLIVFLATLAWCLAEGLRLSIIRPS